MIGQSLMLNGVRKRYEDALAVADVSCQVEPGEFLSILGPSGSGKSTLLTMIAGFETPDAGSVLIGGRDVTGLAPNRRNIGMVFQKYALFPHMTVEDNVGFALRMRRLPRPDIVHRVHRALRLVHLDMLGLRYPHQLSGGQQQRVALARALVFEPPLLLMDEPLGALDKNLREAMQLEIKSLHKELGATVVYVTHDQDEALSMSDRVAVMLNGTLAQIGTPVQLYTQPRSAFIAQFIGKMNLIDCECLGIEADSVVVRLSGTSSLAVPLSNCIGHQTFRRGVRVQLAVRPERLTIAPPGEPHAAVFGHVRTSIFVGAFRIVLVEITAMGNPIIQIQVAASVPLPFAQPGAAVALIPDEGAAQLFAVADGGLQ
ncbi:ABC transporter ATP-binding protein [Phyllobacterium sp. 22229]|uniref:Spermidine/putrescine import ATP-binding protein PotA n=1 Tax=Phyllobacterium myrsinacearum TaxID=28101 RepID=A0A2S9J9R6_9HYPH|nr:polyamine ABC transporter ATP-binding protein [Phyllobacterium myrsinacearum]PWV83494.1 spermidine/putrescine ABC transporter ATP-binding subunit [Phyllobacterium myrsinacearum]RZS70603.1 mannopine transport system ATP-binding protein [Phyllobacterium myrsinacearum]RZU96770.1 mannopine transport system ATP-binding protein [Phyllobacterium myrsinacearum]